MPYSVSQVTVSAGIGADTVADGATMLSTMAMYVGVQLSAVGLDRSAMCARVSHAMNLVN